MTLEATPHQRILCSTAPWFRRPLRQAFRHVAEAGFSSVEVMVTHDPASQEPHLLRDLADEFELRIPVIHGPFLLMTRRVWGTDPVGKVYRSVHLAEEVGASIVVIHPPFRWQVPFRRWVDSDLDSFSAATGVSIAVENMFPLRLPAERSVDLHPEEALEHFDRHRELVLDTSHAAVAHLDVLEAYRAYRTKIRHVHLSNNAGKGWDSHLPADHAGVLPLSQLLGELATSGFDGTISLELDLRPWLRDDAALHELLIRNRQFCAKHFARTSAPRP